MPKERKPLITSPYEQRYLERLRRVSNLERAPVTAQSRVTTRITEPRRKPRPAFIPSTSPNSGGSVNSVNLMIAGAEYDVVSGMWTLFNNQYDEQNDISIATAGTNLRAYIAVDEFGDTYPFGTIWISVARGDWTLKNTPLEELIDLHINADGTCIFALGLIGLNAYCIRSTDNGDTWETVFDIENQFPTGGVWFANLRSNINNTGILFTVTNRIGSTSTFWLILSEDNGDTWIVREITLLDTTGYFASPTNAAWHADDRISVCVNVAASNDVQIVVSDDFGTSWNLVLNDNVNGNIVVHGPPITSDSRIIYALLSSFDNTFYLYLESLDNGDTWNAVSTGIPDLGIGNPFIMGLVLLNDSLYTLISDTSFYKDGLSLESSPSTIWTGRMVAVRDA